MGTTRQYGSSTGRSTAKKSRKALLEKCLDEAYDEYVQASQRSCLDSVEGQASSRYCVPPSQVAELLKKYYKQDELLCVQKYGN